MNLIEQIWKQIRSIGFKNELFNSLSNVVDRLYATINKLTKKLLKILLVGIGCVSGV